MVNECISIMELKQCIRERDERFCGRRLLRVFFFGGDPG